MQYIQLKQTSALLVVVVEKWPKLVHHSFFSLAWLM